MIIVEKQARGGGKRAVRYCRSLTTYMRTARRHAAAEQYGISLATYMRREGRGVEKVDERVLATGARMSGQQDSFDAALLELEKRLARRSRLSRKPARHLVASYKGAEEPTPDDCAQVVSMLAEELGCDAGLMLWALHGDTDNRHLHILVLTLDEAGDATPFGPRGQSHEAMQRAIARLEHAQALTPEAGSRYVADENSARRRAPAPVKASKRAPIRTETLQWEADTGIESFTRYAQEMLAPVLELASSWAEAQAGCAQRGATVHKTHRGGELRSGDGLHKVKLSNVDRKLSWPELTRRWGEWEEPTTEIQPYQPRILDLDQARRWLERDLAREPVHAAVQGRIDALQAERATALAALKAHFADQRQQIAALSLVREQSAAIHAAHRATSAQHLADTDAAYRSRIAALRELRQGVDDSAEPGDIDLPEIALPDCSLAIEWGQGAHTRVDVPGYHAVRAREATQYWASDRVSRRPAFVERGSRIWMNDTSDAALRAALIVAKARYGDVMAFGDEAFVRRAAALGEQLGIKVQVGPPRVSRPPRPRSTRVAQRRDVVRAACSEDATRMHRIRQRQYNLFEQLLAGMDDDSWTLRGELPGSPPDSVRGLEELTEAERSSAGIVVADLSQTRSVDPERQSSNLAAQQQRSPSGRGG